MADQFDPLDIRSEMAASRGVPPTEATPPTTPQEVPPPKNPLQIIAGALDVAPLKAIAPGEPGNEINVENPPDFAVLNREFPPPPPLRRSKRQAGYGPDFTPAKKPRVSSFSSNVLDPDFSSGDNSSNENFEFFARSRPAAATQPSTSAPTAQQSEVGFSSEDEQSLADFLNSLKDAKNKKKAVQEPTTKSDDEPDEEMTQEFEENRPTPISNPSSVLTGGVITKFPVRPHRLVAGNSTSFYSVLHKTAIWNWTPSSNTTVVTRPQALLLFDIGMGRPFDFGQHVFRTVLQFAEGGLKSTRFPFPSLIYGILEAQGFVAVEVEPLIPVGESLKITPGYFKGNRKLDLPWTASGVAEDVGNIVSSSTPTPTVFVMLSPTLLQAQIDFGLKQIQNAKELIAHYEDQIAEYRLLLEVAVHSGPKRGVQGDDGAGAEDEEG